MTTPTTETGTVEKVARAIHDARFEGIAPEYRPHPTRDYSDLEYATRLARAAIAAMPDSTQLLQTMAGAWRDIETAPKDGSYIIAASFARDSQELKWVTHSRWITAAECADAYGDEPGDYEAGWTDGEDEDEPCVPTHWMPLEPPAQFRAQEQRS